MKRIQDKVKDIVEVRPFRSIRDFTADPAETLSNYHFTDATADLMAKWLDGIAAVQPGKGIAYALAGYRGVGKSHFLATLGALAASPDLRGRIAESHVEFSAQRLQRRHYPVSYLRRGTHATLLEEFKASVSQTFQIDSIDRLNSFDEVLAAGAERSADTPWILLIDTALERGSRVTRDDGGELSAIAEAARAHNIFVGVALDDDIAGADGSNAAIVRSYSIDYLDQAHLYKVVNAHIFPKDTSKQPILHDIYGYFREVLPSFRWSEQKFSSLYPLHPAILEVAPYVRLYVHDFALLGFASEAGEKILGRPANSLIALDEVYDNAESGLRKIEDLHEAFAAYDTLNSTVVNKIPVMQRLQAKLILKALLLLSLDGQGATACEICASELIFDESDPEKAGATVVELLQTFAEALPNDFRVVVDDGVEPRYSFKVSSKENLNNALAQAIGTVSSEVVPGVLRREFNEKFPETAGDEGVIQTSLVWRGAVRKGRLIWPGSARQVSETPGRDWSDWEVVIDFDGTYVADAGGTEDVARIMWKPDPLRPDEVEKLRSYYALNNDAGLREKFSDQIRASIHAHSMAAEKILTRSFLEDGQLVIDGFDYNFTEEARSAQTLSEMFGAMLEPLFETRYPSHPYFTRTLEYGDFASIVTDLYNGTRRDLADVQSRAQTFAFPLGLVRLEGTSFLPETHDRLGTLPIAGEILGLVEKGGTGPVLLDAVHTHLSRAPYGLGIEAQEMVITALVAERYIEFVTKSGNRINHRSLDLRIIWDDIVGVARPIESSSSAAKLKPWAKHFLKDVPFESLDRPADRAALVEVFGKWVGEWDQARTLEGFAELPEDMLNVRIWQLAAKASKTFGSFIDKLRGAADGSVPLEECLDRIADAFSGTPADLVQGEQELGLLASFVRSAGLREECKAYLAASEVTDVVEIEAARDRVIGLIDAATADPNETYNRELGYAAEKFKREYADHFQSRHSSVMAAADRKAKFAEIMKSDEWAEFEILSKLPLFDIRYAASANEYRRQLSGLECSADVRKNLERHPYCACGFSLNKSVDAQHLPAALTDVIREGLAAFRARIVNNCDDVIAGVEKLAVEASDPDVESACRTLISSLRSGKVPPKFGDVELKVLAEVTSEHPRETPKSSPAPQPRQAPKADTNQSFKDVQLSEPVDEEILLNV